MLCGTHQGRKLKETVSQRQVGFYVAACQPQTKHHIKRSQSRDWGQDRDRRKWDELAPEGSADQDFSSKGKFAFPRL